VQRNLKDIKKSLAWMQHTLGAIEQGDNRLEQFKKQTAKLTAQAEELLHKDWKGIRWDS
jgi:hypothetical protein